MNKHVTRGPICPPTTALAAARAPGPACCLHAAGGRRALLPPAATAACCLRQDYELEENEDLMVCYYKDKQAPGGHSAFKGKWYKAVAKGGNLSAGFVVQYKEDPSTIETGVAHTSIKMVA